jgi:hypothetical protein
MVGTTLFSFLSFGINKKEQQLTYSEFDKDYDQIDYNQYNNSIVKGPRRIFQLYNLGKLNTGFCRARKVTSNGI